MSCDLLRRGTACDRGTLPAPRVVVANPYAQLVEPPQLARASEPDGHPHHLASRLALDQHVRLQFAVPPPDVEVRSDGSGLRGSLRRVG